MSTTRTTGITRITRTTQRLGRSAPAAACALTLTLTFAAPPRAAAQDVPEPAAPAPRALETRIDAVTVHPDGARVLRVSAPLEAGGRYLVRDLPAALDPEHVRVRCTGAYVVSVEVRERVAPAVPEARLEELRARAAQYREQLRDLGDARSVLAGMQRELEALLAAGVPDAAPEPGRASLEAGRAREVLLAARALLEPELAANLRAQRENGWQREELERALSDLEAELGAVSGERAVRTREAAVELDLRGGGAPRLELEYLVPGAGWSPEYDLRTAGDARAVEVVHRARVRQQTGETWTDVALSLSTARPRRGAQGPDPEPRWVDLVSPSAPRASARRGLVESEAFYADAERPERSKGLAAPALATPFASVESAGLSLVYRLPRRETVESREEETVVLVGEASLAVEPEHVCAPAESETVWLRGRATNTSEWTFLPGPAAVFFGDEYLGRSTLGEVQRGDEIVLHLGAVSALRCERIETRDETSGPGFLGSKKTLTRGVRVRVENNGARVTAPDGSARVVVREALPRSTDSRVDVSLDESRPEPSKEPRWGPERDELGVETWVLTVPRGGSAQLDYVLEVDYPKDLELWIR